MRVHHGREHLRPAGGFVLIPAVRIASALRSLRPPRPVEREVGVALGLGMELLYGGEQASFSSLRANDSESAILNLERGDSVSRLGRLILHVTDVDAFWTHLKEKGFDPEIPRDASWGETLFPHARSGWPRAVVCSAAAMSWLRECVQTRCVWR